MCTMPMGTFFFSRFLNAFFLPFFSGAPPVAPAPAPAAAGLAILSFSFLVPGFALRSSRFALRQSEWRAANSDYVFAADFFFWATVPLRGPLRVRALVWVRWPRTGRLRR